MKALLVIGLLAGDAAADRWSRAADRVQGGGYLHYELSGWTALDDDSGRMTTPRDSDRLVLAGVRLGGFLGAGATVGYHVALDLFAGSTLASGGFAYDVAVYPIGIAARFGPTSVLAIAAGIGGSGAVGTIDDGAIVPVQATLEVGKSLRLIARARASYVLGAAGRQSAAPSAPFADEFDATLGVRLGRYYKQHGFPTGNGYFVAAGYREQLGTRFLGVTIGYSIDVALPRRFLDEDRQQR
ncbi:MAG: hypothetical protein H0V17_24330 [Deltaproteobacteria bacterium]|nr:hypothetical protein [Deltaproteobacteria bacterium]